MPRLCGSKLNVNDCVRLENKKTYGKKISGLVKDLEKVQSKVI